MRVRWLGWAGAELESRGTTVVIDPLADAAAVFAPLGSGTRDIALPRVVAPTAGRAVAGLVTHLHRDHADAAALAPALIPGAPVLQPRAGDGGPAENLGLMQADLELAAAGLDRRHLDWWDVVTAPPFTITALPAVDGLGDPQLSWLVEADGRRVLHLGDTMNHGYWWRIAQRLGPFDVVMVPVNGAVVDFPHRQPASSFPVAMTPDQAAVAARILGAGVAVPIHAEGYDVHGAYEPCSDAARSFAAAAARHGVEVVLPEPGESLELQPTGERLARVTGPGH